MKTKGLQIGNLIQDKYGNIEIVNQLLTAGDYIDRVNDEPYDGYYLPIHLTEEWLLKMGFTSRLETNGFYTYTNGVIEFQLHKQAYGDRLTLYDGSTDFEETKSFAPPLDYVHQLQNLYFALTGEELTIKEL